MSSSLLLSRPAMKLYMFMSVNALILMAHNQWIMASVPASLKENVQDRSSSLRGWARVGRPPLDAGSIEHLDATTRWQLDADRGLRRSGHLAAHEHDDAFLPKSQTVIEDIYQRGRDRIKAELARRNNNISNIEPFNPWGPVYIWDWFSPDYNCPTMERVGRVGDGGKWMCGLDFLRSKEKDCLVYSFGVNRDLSFELELVSRTGGRCQVHAFDPTVGGVPSDCKDNPRITFHKQALGPQTGPTDTFMNVESLLDTMKRLGHTYVDLLKVDIEGSEWDTFKAMLPSQVEALPFGQLLIELHFRNTTEVFDFFDNMDAHGYRIFMRETNHNPCAAGKLPIAVEFSLINPDVYFKGKSQPAAIQAVASRPVAPRYNAAIYTLTRRSNMQRLRHMLLNLDKHYLREYPYPVVVFHEGDLTPQDQAAFRAAAPTLQRLLEFRRVTFSIPDWLDKDMIPERTPCSYHSSTVGYRHMNRFLAYFAAKQLAGEYEWQWRLDDDSVITEPVGYDVFDLMARNQKRYGFTNVVQDDAKCVLGLWDAAKTYIDQHKIDTTFFTRWREGAVFYNNFEVSHASIWTSAEYEGFFNYIDQLGGIYYHRWGDAPIRSIGVSMFVPEREVHHFTDVAYTHLPFIQRNASGLPAPTNHTLFPRGGDVSLASAMAHGNSTNTTAGSNSTLIRLSDLADDGVPVSGVVYTVLRTPSDEAVTQLEAMLRSLDRYFNGHFHYPVAIFSRKADPLTTAQRTALRAASTSVLEFIDMDDGHGTDTDLIRHLGLDPGRVPRHAACAFGDDSVGDRRANRYMAMDAVTRKLGEQYDWMWRLAPDGQLTENVTTDPFKVLARSGKRYGYLTMVQDDAQCVEGLWEAARAYAKQQGVEPTFLDVLPDSTTFYNGFEISHASLWTSPEYRRLFDFLDRRGGMLYHRWNEANIHTIALSLFTRPEELHRFTELGYEHWPFIKQLGHKAQQSASRRPLRLSHPTLGKLHVEAAPELSPVLAARRFGYLGSDVATSFRLPPSSPMARSHYAWLLGDTFIGTSDLSSRREEGHAVVHNALAFVPMDMGSSPSSSPSPVAEDVHFHWRIEERDGQPASAFVYPGDDNDGNRLLWPVSAVSVEYGEGEGKVAKIIMLAQRVAKKHDLMQLLVSEGMNFEVEGTSVIVVDNPQASPSRWQYRVADVPGTHKDYNWFSAIAVEGGQEVATSADDWLYIMGNVGTRGMGVFEGATKEVLGRIRVRDMVSLRFAELQVLTGHHDDHTQAWVPLSAPSASPDALRAVLPRAVPELTLQYDARLGQGQGQWVAMEVHGQTAQLVLWTAPQPWGPWTSTTMYNIPAPYSDLATYRCYAGKGHPELASAADGGGAGDVELVFSYVCNSPHNAQLLFEEGHLDLYTPSFVRLRVDADAVSH